jgi:neutral ceramidase
LLDTGEMKYLHTWQPEILDIQLFRLGNLFIYAVPSEFTTMSGRRLRTAIKQAVIKHGLGDQQTVVIHSGPANGYAVCVLYDVLLHRR